MWTSIPVIHPDNISCAAVFIIHSRRVALWNSDHFRVEIVIIMVCLMNCCASNRGQSCSTPVTSLSPVLITRVRLIPPSVTGMRSCEQINPRRGSQQQIIWPNTWPVQPVLPDFVVTVLLCSQISQLMHGQRNHQH